MTDVTPRFNYDDLRTDQRVREAAAVRAGAELALGRFIRLQPLGAAVDVHRVAAGFGVVLGPADARRLTNRAWEDGTAVRGPRTANGRRNDRCGDCGTDVLP